MLEYKQVRKTFITQRADELTKKQIMSRREAKELACQEFDDFMEVERDKAIFNYLHGGD